MKPLYAVVDGKPEHHPEVIYNLRHLKAGKLMWDAVGAYPQLALRFADRILFGADLVPDVEMYRLYYRFL